MMLCWKTRYLKSANGRRQADRLPCDLRSHGSIDLLPALSSQSIITVVWNVRAAISKTAPHGTLVNTYDNTTIRHTDYVLAQMIEKLKQYSGQYNTVLL